MASATTSHAKDVSQEQEHQSATTTHSTSQGGLAGVVDTFGLRTDLFVAQLINFTLVLIILWRFVYRPILRLLDARERKIAESVKNADEAVKRLKSIETEKEEILAAARAEANEYIAKVTADTEERKTKMLTEAKTEVSKIVEAGKSALAADREAMLVGLRKEIVELAVEAAEKVIAHGVDQNKSQSLAEEVIRKLT